MKNLVSLFGSTILALSLLATSFVGRQVPTATQERAVDPASESAADPADEAPQAEPEVSAPIEHVAMSKDDPRKYGHHAPPLLIPSEVTAATQYVEMNPVTDAVNVAYVGLDGIDAIPTAWLNDPLAFRIDTRGLAQGRYRFAAIGAADDGAQTRADFVLVKGVSPIPPGPNPPGPNPPPEPAPPLDDLAKQAQAWLKAVPPANYAKVKAEGVAGVYTSVAAQAAAAGAGWNLDTFRTQTKTAVFAKLGSDDMAAWAVPFFKPLADAQAKLFQDRKLTATDVPGITKLWQDTGDAIKKAAY